MTICYLGIGSNLHVPERQVRQAILSIRKQLPQSSVIQVAALYFSKALGLNAQPDFCNSVIKLKTYLSPSSLLEHCKNIETQYCRIRKRKWGARTLDIDILLYGNQTIISPQLSIPHSQMHKRDFVLVPLVEIEPDICFPNGELIRSFIQDCESYLLKY